MADASSRLHGGDAIAAATFAAAWLAPGGPPSAPLARERTSAGYAALRQRRAATRVAPGATLVVMEATGNDWVALAVALHEAGYVVGAVTPRQAHHFATARRRRAKTDDLDAQDPARLAAQLRPAPRTPPPAAYHEVRRRLVARDALPTMRQQARHQRHAPLQWPVVAAGGRRHLAELVADLGGRLADVEAASAAALAGSAWAESPACLTSAPGIGRVTAAGLLVGTRNFARAAGPAAATASFEPVHQRLDGHAGTGEHRVAAVNVRVARNRVALGDSRSHGPLDAMPRRQLAVTTCRSPGRPRARTRR